MENSLAFGIIALCMIAISIIVMLTTSNKAQEKHMNPEFKINSENSIIKTETIFI